MFNWNIRSAMILITILSLLILSQAAPHDSASLCFARCRGAGPNRYCVYRLRIDIHASETGYFQVDGCEGVQPILTMEAGVEYTFKQIDPTNWMHPLGFAYLPDGALAGNDELSPFHNLWNSSCIETWSCQHPKYLGGRDSKKFLGVEPVDSTGNNGFGSYERQFLAPRFQWLRGGNRYEVKLTVTDPTLDEFFYFCRVHRGMSGRIKVVDPISKALRSSAVRLPLPYSYQRVSSFDKKCGTYNTKPYKKGAGCGDSIFVCDLQGHPHKSFGKCLIALDCKMHSEMRVSLHWEDPTVTFMHQMIPHHANAVNMAKLLLKSGAVTSSNDRTGEIQDLLWNIINTQNRQITQMRHWLGEHNYPLFGSCPVTPASTIGTSKPRALHQLTDMTAGLNYLLGSGLGLHTRRLLRAADHQIDYDIEGNPLDAAESSKTPDKLPETPTEPVDSLPAEPMDSPVETDDTPVEYDKPDWMFVTSVAFAAVLVAYIMGGVFWTQCLRRSYDSIHTPHSSEAVSTGASPSSTPAPGLQHRHVLFDTVVPFTSTGGSGCSGGSGERDCVTENTRLLNVHSDTKLQLSHPHKCAEDGEAGEEMKEMSLRRSDCPAGSQYGEQQHLLLPTAKQP